MYTSKTLCMNSFTYSFTCRIKYLLTSCPGIGYRLNLDIPGIICMSACVHQTWGQVFVFDVYELKVFVFKYFPKVFDCFISNTFFKHIVSINISVSRSHVMPAKLITFTANHLSPKKYFQPSKYSLIATYLTQQW